MKDFLLYVMATLYMIAGAMHFIFPKIYKRIMPRWVPWPVPVVYASGITEILLGILLLPTATRQVAAIGIMVLLIVIFPANVQMAQNFKRKNNPYLWLAILRLPLQALLVWWAWLYT